MTPQRLRTKLRKIREHGEEMAEEGGELNLVPYLDIVTNVIMFMLATTTFAAALGDINVSSPTTSQRGLQRPAAARAEERAQPDGLDLRQGLHHRRLGRGALPGLHLRRRGQPGAAAGHDAADDPEEGQRRVRLRLPRQEDAARSRAHRRRRARPR